MSGHPNRLTELLSQLGPDGNAIMSQPRRHCWLKSLALLFGICVVSTQASPQDSSIERWVTVKYGDAGTASAFVVCSIRSDQDKEAVKAVARDVHKRLLVRGKAATFFIYVFDEDPALVGGKEWFVLDADKDKIIRERWSWRKVADRPTLQHRVWLTRYIQLDHEVSKAMEALEKRSGQRLPAREFGAKREAMTFERLADELLQDEGALRKLIPKLLEWEQSWIGQR